MSDQAGQIRQQYQAWLSVQVEAGVLSLGANSLAKGTHNILLGSNDNNRSYNKSNVRNNRSKENYKSSFTNQTRKQLEKYVDSIHCGED